MRKPRRPRSGPVAGPVAMALGRAGACRPGALDQLLDDAPDCRSRASRSTQVYGVTNVELG